MIQKVKTHPSYHFLTLKTTNTMDTFTPYIPFIKSTLWYLFLFGMAWQFLRWLILTRWLIKTIEHWVGYLLKQLIQYLIAFCAYLWNSISQNGKLVIQEFWRYRIGKISLVSLGGYLLYIAYSFIFSS